MTENETLSTVHDIMAEFAARTGLITGLPPTRYLWTDAFAVCNYLGLYTATGEDQYRDLAARLIDQVHHVLGKHRPGAPQEGWLSDLEGQEAEAHPTAGGLRIGKKLPERGVDERFDQQLEWDRDGQYFHYLAQWMHALDRAAHVLDDLTYNRWAMELAERVHAAFVYRPAAGGPPRMYWKMSVDLSRPLVPTMGHHDPLAAYVTYRALAATSPCTPDWPDLTAEIGDAEEMIWGRDWTTEDPLGIGGLLADAYRVAQLVATRDFDHADLALVLLESALIGLMGYAEQGPLNQPAAHRLGFRELGLSIGLRAGERLPALIEREPDRFDRKELLRQRLQSLQGYLPMAGQIERFWLEPSNRATRTWQEHLDINEVMLATSLAPDGYLER
ncbi:MAG TPA: hypothetical protein VLC95_19175 [Anaerolineae bacterium]|nr:hypothetical protein [Anaerolineae bacterium]